MIDLNVLFDTVIIPRMHEPKKTCVGINGLKNWCPINEIICFNTIICFNEIICFNVKYVYL